MLPSQGRAAVRLIPKINKLGKIGDYRPISLLNCDYKLLASVLASRLRRTLRITTKEHQKGGVPGRYIYIVYVFFVTLFNTLRNDLE